MEHERWPIVGWRRRTTGMRQNPDMALRMSCGRNLALIDRASVSWGTPLAPRMR